MTIVLGAERENSQENVFTQHLILSLAKQQGFVAASVVNISQDTCEFKNSKSSLLNHRSTV
jgi:hypothetical protein